MWKVPLSQEGFFVFQVFFFFLFFSWLTQAQRDVISSKVLQHIRNNKIFFSPSFISAIWNVMGSLFFLLPHFPPLFSFVKF